MEGKRAEDGCWTKPNTRLLWHVQLLEPLDHHPTNEIIEVLEYGTQSLLVCHGIEALLSRSQQLVSQSLCMGIEIVGCRDKGGRRVMKKDDDVGTPLVVADDDDRTACSSRAERVERRRH
jgi:hypothetical protein